ncbi:MAG: S8 family serine peptidase [Pyrinomonadaceae bacterium]
MKFLRTSPRVVILVASVISVVGFCAIFWNAPQSAQVKRKARAVTKASPADEVTNAIRNPQKSLVRVRVDGQKDREAAAKLGTIVADNESFVLLAADSLPPALSNDFAKVETSINLPGSSFDPLKSPPAETVSASADAASLGKGYYIVQFGVTATDELLDDLRGAGSTIIQYIPHQAFVVYGDGEAIGRAAAHSRVRWVGRYLPEYKPSKILRAQLTSATSGRQPKKGISGLENTGDATAVFDVAVFSNADLETAAANVASATSGKVRNVISLPNNFFNIVRVEANSAQIEEASKVEEVFSIESWGQPTKEDEVAAQIVAGNYAGNVVAPAGYDPLTQFGVNGQGVTVAVVDDGVGIPGDGGFYLTAGNTINGPSRGTTAGAQGHGHLQASIIAGDTPYSVLDPNGYNYGIGIAPKSNILNIPFLRSGYTGTEANTADDVVTTVGPNGVLGYISNNSWGNGLNSNAYDSYAAQFDGFVRDASTGASIDPIALVFSAGNQGTSGLTRPKVAKNLISVAATENVRSTLSSAGGSTGVADNIEQLPDFSSRGPTADNRVKPDISAPGDAVTGSRSGPDVLFGNIDSFHRVSSGTSHASPQVAGAAALFTQYWKSNNSGANPSPAMIKAALINGAVDVTGTGATASRPNGSEGWGRINLKNVLNTGAAISYIDQSVALSTVGEIRNFIGSIPDSSRPVRVSLVWTDPPGAGDPALVNDIDLEVLVGGNKYRGNVLTGGSSVIGGSADVRNNVENVFLPAGSSGPVTIRVIAKTLNGDGILGNADTTDQHFALVVYNGTVAVSSAASPEGGQPVVVSGNSVIEPSECNIVNIPVTNLGQSTATGVTATLSTTTPGVSVTVASASYPNIAPGAASNGISAFQVSTTNAIACATNVDLVLTVSYAGMTAPAVFNYTLTVGSPAATNYGFTSSNGATISAGGTLVPGSSADDDVLNFTVPFGFSVYDTPVPSGSTIRLGTNGNIRIESSGAVQAAVTNAALPSTGGSGSPFPAALPVLSPYWDDLDLRTSTTTGGGIFTEVTGSPGSQTLKIEWRARNYVAAQPAAAPNVQFAVYFHENSSSFEYIYGLTGGTGSFVSGSSATVGVQSATTGTNFTQFSFNSPSLSPGLMLSATRPAGACSPGFGPCVFTAAGVAVSGRVLTPESRGIRGATVVLADGNGKTYRGTTNTFGYFTIKDVSPATASILTASARGYTFQSRVVDLSADVSDVLIVAER